MDCDSGAGHVLLWQALLLWTSDISKHVPTEDSIVVSPEVSRNDIQGCITRTPGNNVSPPQDVSESSLLEGETGQSHTLKLENASPGASSLINKFNVKGQQYLQFVDQPGRPRLPSNSLKKYHYS